jgi:glutathione synthase/RimK-type ligase-like ATP-grasp enzyme
MLAIHDSFHGFHPRWFEYCRVQRIAHKAVNCYAPDIVRQLKGCSALFWHFSQSDPRDIVVARQILFSLEHAGFQVFPDFRTAWHFDDKVGQKYLFELLDIPSPPAHVFVERAQALEWAARTAYPKVFKLRHGAGSAGVRLVRSEKEADRLIRRAFGRGFPVYDPWDNLKERVYKWRLGKFGAMEILKALVRFAYPPRFSTMLGRQRGYIYFQDYLPNNDSDIRVIVIGERAFGIKRWVRPGDFRASGSGRFSYDPADIDRDCIELAFESARKLGGSCLAFDFVRTLEGQPVILEVSYGFIKEVYDPCPGYWDAALKWHEGKFNPQAWMVDLVMERFG